MFSSLIGRSQSRNIATSL